MKYFPAKKIFFASISLSLSPLIMADATVIYEQISNTQKSVNTMQLKDGKIRFTPPSQNKNYSLYDSQTGTLTHVDVANKQYLKMNEDDIAQQANQAKMQMEKMRQLMLEKMKVMWLYLTGHTT
ncbi:hypothetical protein [sulfur-oxidizing endosymbiont of Gigantopelta aegis]|uniref:hypothetical protein n=1 Tax=sulfur-oxidizing endosymbiont of Gigantopelta aegis TaxID=2794934 RepID=UPI0018DD9B84|nr:hypothetical protein [sulfur-oxidizing endosymbiont of Gigantopelta aegis]